MLFLFVSLLPFMGIFLVIIRVIILVRRVLSEGSVNWPGVSGRNYS